MNNQTASMIESRIRTRDQLIDAQCRLMSVIQPFINQKVKILSCQINKMIITETGELRTEVQYDQDTEAALAKIDEVIDYLREKAERGDHVHNGEAGDRI